MTSQKILMNHRNPSSLLRRSWVLILLTVSSVALSQVQAAVDTPDPGPKPISNTADGLNALLSITTGIHNAAFGFDALLLTSDTSFNTAVGSASLLLNIGNQNTAVGTAALLNNSSGENNNAVGAFALINNTIASFNNAHGREALLNNIDGSENNAFGDLALESSVSDFGNSAFGDDALDSLNGGDQNTAMGDEAGNSIIDGSNNVCVGASAGTGIVHASNNIAIGSAVTGPFADFDNTCFIGSIFGQIVSDPGTQTEVFVDQFNVVGVRNSSRRYKHDIQPMDKASETLYRLKPVTFKFNSDWKGTTQYGLIAEDVAKVDPQLVSRKDGDIITVHYEQINSMLLNEFLKEHKKVEEQQATITELKSTVAQQQKGMDVLRAQLKEQSTQIQKVSVQLEVSTPVTKVVLEKP